MEHIEGYIEHIIFSNSNNGYTVFELSSDTGDITCVGILGAAGEGEKVRLFGDYTTHPMYGDQFSFNSYEEIEATDDESIVRYLGSGAIKGLGPVIAKRIVDMFGDETFMIMEENPELLARIKGISKKKALEIAAQVVSKQELRKVMMFLADYGISNNLSMKIYSEYKDSTFEVMKNNPYRLAEDIDGVGFRTADEIAMKAGIPTDSEYRIKCGIQYVLSQAVGEGHIYLPKDILVSRSSNLLDCDAENVWILTQNLAMEKRVVIANENEEICVYLNNYNYMENACARMLNDLDVCINDNFESIVKVLDSFEKDDEKSLDDMQKKAVVSAIQNGLSVITGGPGTGKTTTINRILQYFSVTGEEFLLAAPTGRAAKRMTETTGYEASTVQRLLGLSMSDTNEKYMYDKNEQNPLEVDAVIVDEMSMVDMPLLFALLKAMVPGTRLIMVGDINQLPSVGPGSVLKDVISSNVFCVTRLNKIYRQDEESDIIVNAHKINDGIVPDFTAKSKDFFLLKRNDVNVILKHMVTLILEKLPKYVNATSFDIQVLTPMRKGPLGVESLNPILQKYINPPTASKKEKEYAGVTFREGDKVMQIKNNYQLQWEVRGKYGIVAESGLGIFNGDLGYIGRIDPVAEIIEVVYEDNHIVTYPYSALDELDLAYAVTIHKSQGSEYPAVIMPLLNGPKMLFNRNLLYTGITRAKALVVMLGSEDTVREMIANTSEQKRYTNLASRILNYRDI